MAGTRTRAQLRSEVDSNLGERGDLDDRINLWLDDAQIWIALEHDFAELRRILTSSVTQGGLDYAWPDTLKSVYDLRLMDGVNSRKLVPQSTRYYDKIQPDPTSLGTEGRPRNYVPWGRCFELDPVPDDTYTLRLRASLWPTPFSGDSSLSDYDHKDQLIVEVTTAIGYARLQEKEESATHLTFAQNLLIRHRTMDVPIRDFANPGRPEFTTEPPNEYWADPFVGLPR